MANKLVIEGSIYDTDSENNVNKLINTTDVSNGDGISVEVVNEKVKISSDLGIKIVDGVPCMVYAVDETEV